MNETINIIKQHRSIRQFKNEPLTSEQIHTIIQAAQHASTSSYVMAYTVIGVTDESVKAKLQEVSGQDYVKDNGHLFVFCADLHRNYQQGDSSDKERMQETLQSTEQFLVATIDTALVAQNSAIAAEAMGLGICFLGSLRNDIKRVNDILELPDYVVPLFGMAIGYPDEQPEQKPRMPFELVYHENKYKPYHEQETHVEAFNRQLETYYQERSVNKRLDTWSDQIRRKYEKAIRLDVASFLRRKKLNNQ